MIREAGNIPRVLRKEPAAEFYTEERCHILELDNDPVDPQCSIARARVAAGVETQWHRLRDTTERYVMLEGQGEVSVGELVEPVGPGDVVLIPAGVRQKIRNTGTVDLVFLAVCTPRFQQACYERLEF